MYGGAYMTETMTRLADMSDAEIHATMLTEIAAGHIIEATLANPRLSRAARTDNAHAVELIHDELERLTAVIVGRGSPLSYGAAPSTAVNIVAPSDHRSEAGPGASPRARAGAR